MNKCVHFSYCAGSFRKASGPQARAGTRTPAVLASRLLAPSLEFLTQYNWGEAQEFTFLPSSQLMLLLGTGASKAWVCFFSTLGHRGLLCQ